MRAPGRQQSILAAIVSIVLACSVGWGAGEGTAQTTPPATTTPPGTTPGVSVAIEPMGGVASRRLAKSREIAVSLRTSGAARIQVNVWVPRRVARSIGVRVKPGATRGLLASKTVEASKEGYVAAFPAISGRVARRLAERPRRFDATIIATPLDGGVAARGTLRVTKGS